MFDLNKIKQSPLLGAFGFGGSSSSLGGRTGSRFMRFSFPGPYTERTDGNFKIVRITASQTVRVVNYASSPTNNTVDLFIIAGGGNGPGGGYGGGGGAGGVIDYPSYNLSTIPSIIPLTVGGAGSNSTFSGLTAIGGGNGGGTGGSGGSGGGGGGCVGYRCGGGGGGTGFQKTTPNPYGITGDSITYGWGYPGNPGTQENPRFNRGAGPGGGAGGSDASGRNLPNPLGGPGNSSPLWSSGTYAKGGYGGSSNQTPTLAGDGGGTGQAGAIFMRYRFK